MLKCAVNMMRRLKHNRNLSNHVALTTYSRNICQQSNSSCTVQKCWHCSNVFPNTMFCPACGKLQEPSTTMNYFRILSLDENFEVDDAQLSTQFRKLQSIVHPDKFSRRDEAEQTYSLEWSSLLNSAFKTLAGPINRAEYILKINGISIPEDNTTLDYDFLLEIMQRNEEVEAANKNNVWDLLDRVRKDLDVEKTKLAKEFALKNYDAARLTVIKMKYFRSLENSIKEKAVFLGVIK